MILPSASGATFSEAVGLPPHATAAPDLAAIPPAVDAHQLLERVAQQLRKQMAAKRIELTMKLAARGYLIPGDRERLRLIYTNLLSNAVTYAAKGSQIIVRSSCPTPDALRVEVLHGLR